MSGVGVRVTIVTAVVVLWRFVAYVWPSPLIELDDELRLPMTLLGLSFVGCGCATWIARPGRWTWLLFAAAAGGGIHWGGTPGFGSETLDLGLLLVYLGLSVAGEAALLHLAIVYPVGGWVTMPLRVVFYAPAVAALGVAPFVGLVPQGQLALLVVVLMQLGTAYSVVAMLVFLINAIRLHGEMRREARLTIILIAFLVGGGATLLPSLGVAPGPAEAWHLAAIAIPLALAYALISTRLDAPGP